MGMWKDSLLHTDDFKDELITDKQGNGNSNAQKGNSQCNTYMFFSVDCFFFVESVTGGPASLVK